MIFGVHFVARRDQRCKPFLNFHPSSLFVFGIGVIVILDEIKEHHD